MSTESNKTAVYRFHDAFNAGALDGIDKLTIKDTGWASNILEQAFYTDQLLNFIYGDTINEPGKLNWFFRATFRLAALYGECFSTAENVPIYQKFGFEVVSDKEIPKGSLHNWGMLRQKR